VGLQDQGLRSSALGGQEVAVRSGPPAPAREHSLMLLDHLAVGPAAHGAQRRELGEIGQLAVAAPVSLERSRARSRARPRIAPL
jgi:hypothetical protein